MSLVRCLLVAAMLGPLALAACTQSRTVASSSCLAAAADAMSGKTTLGLAACPEGYQAVVAGFRATAAYNARKAAGMSDDANRTRLRAETERVRASLETCSESQANAASLRSYCKSILADENTLLGGPQGFDPADCSNRKALFIRMDRAVTTHRNGAPFTPDELATAESTVHLFETCDRPREEFAMRATAHAYLGVMAFVGDGTRRDPAESAHEFSTAEQQFRDCFRNVDPALDPCRAGLKATKAVRSAYR